MKSKAEVMRGLARVRRRKIVIQRKETVKDAGGDITTSWVDWKTVWAEKQSLGAGLLCSPGCRPGADH